MSKDLVTNLHGTAVNIYDYGVLITGESGIGKTELALSLIDRGHKFIADDSVMVETIHQNSLLMSTNQEATGYMHVRGLGFLQVRQLYNLDRVFANSKLDIIIELVNDGKLLNKDLHIPLMDKLVILDISVTRFKLPIGQGRNLTLLSEVIVKYYNQLLNGHDSNLEFINSRLK